MTCCEALTNCTYMNPFFLILKYEGFIQKHHPYTGNLNREKSGTVQTPLYIVEMF